MLRWNNCKIDELKMNKIVSRLIAISNLWWYVNYPYLSIYLDFQMKKKPENPFNSSSHTRFDKSGLLKFQTLLRVRQGQHKNFLLQWLFYIVLSGWDMAQNVNLGWNMKTEKTEKWWYFLKDDDHRWLFDNRNVGDNYWKTAFKTV